MWVFFAVVSILIFAVVAWLLIRYPLWSVPFIVRAVVTYSWLTSVSIIVYIPVDVWATSQGKDVFPIYVMWEISFWSTQFLTWFIIPFFMGYVDSGRFSVIGKMWSSVRQNLFFYALLLLLSVFGFFFAMTAGNLSVSTLPGTCIALTNMFGLIVVIFLMGYGLVSVPRATWRLANPEVRLKKTHCNLEKIADKLQETMKEMERVHLVVHASAQQISRRDALRPYMDIVWKEFLANQVSGLDLEEKRNLDDHITLLTTEELDYAIELKGLVELRRRVRDASIKFEGVRTEYTYIVKHGLLLTEICKRKQNHVYSEESDGEILWKKLYWYGECVLSPIIRRFGAGLFVLMSVIVIWCELVIIGEKANLSPVHWLMTNAKTEWAYYWVVLLPLVYMFFCTYHTLFNLAAFQFFQLIPRASSSYMLLLNGTLMCRFAPPLAYNFLHVIQMMESDHDQKTAFSQVMGVMRVLPFFGNAFNSVLPIFLLVHCLLIWMDAWKRIHSYIVPKRFQYYDEDANVEDSAKGRLILAKEHDAQQQGKRIGQVLGIDGDRDAAIERSAESVTLGTPLVPGEQDSVTAGGGFSFKGSLDYLFSSIKQSNSKRQGNSEEVETTSSRRPNQYS